MALTTRRQFIHQTSLAAAALCGRPVEAFGGTRPIFGVREQKSASLDPATIRELAFRIKGHIITLEASDYESSRLVENRAFDPHPALIVRCATVSDITQARATVCLWPCGAVAIAPQAMGRAMAAW